MLDINEKTHIATVIGSLEKIYNSARMNGQLYPEEIYILESIYKLLSGCTTALTNKNRRTLLALYNKILYRSKYICPSTIMEDHTVKPKIKFIQAETQDCNQVIISPKIFYWQDNLSSDSTLLVDDAGYMSDKPFDSYPNFILGKDINYIDIGKICFLATSTSITSTFKILDSLNNDVTHTFIISFVSGIKSTFFRSQNIYSHGIINFKIIKLI